MTLNSSYISKSSKQYNANNLHSSRRKRANSICGSGLHLTICKQNEYQQKFNSSVPLNTSNKLLQPVEFHTVCHEFLARDSIYAIARYMLSPVRLSVRPSVCLSVKNG